MSDQQQPTLIRGAAAMVNLNGVDDIVVFAETSEALLKAIGSEVAPKVVHCTMMPGPRFIIPPAAEGPTPEGFAAIFDGRQYGDEITPEEELALKAAGMVAVFGYSDDCAEFRGAVRDETGYGEIRITAKGKLLNDEQNEALASLVADGLATDARVGIIHSDHTREGWRFTTTIPHAVFNILEGDEHFGQGIVFRLADVEGREG